MDGRFHDGRSARPHTVSVSIDGRSLRILGAAEARIWTLDDLTVTPDADQVRLSHPSDPDARLVLNEADWRTLRPEVLERAGRTTRSPETRLIVALVAVAAATTAFVFLGVPALSGPLARATPVSYEKGMGDNFDLQIGALFRACSGEEGQAALTRLGRRLEAVADTPFDIRVRAVQAPMLNAFALPGGSIIVTDDLIAEAETPDELAAVIAHEVAHVEKRHVMQAVWRSLGIGLALDVVVGGGTGAGQQAVLLAGQATDLRYGRAAESEADARGQALLHELGLSSSGMARFFGRLGADNERVEDVGNRLAEFAATHPLSDRRARAARAVERDGAAAFDEAEWQAIKAACPAQPPRIRVLPPVLRVEPLIR